MTRIAINQNLKSLAQIKHFAFDLDAPGFVDYYVSRTGDCINETVSPWAEIKEKILDPEKARAVPTIADPRVTVDLREVYKITRARLQDCWEIWTQPGFNR